MRKQRLSYIDQAKGIGILLIVLGHVTWSIDDFSNFASYFRVVIFYIISGFLQSLSVNSVDLRNKAKSLLIPYTVFSILFILLNIIKNLFKGSDFNTIVSSLVLEIINFSTLRGNSSLWFFPTLFIALVTHNYLMDRKLRFFMLICVPFVAVFFSKTFFINSIGSFSKFEYCCYCVYLTLSKSMVAWWFFELSYITFKKVFHINKILPICALIGGYFLTAYLENSAIEINNFKFGNYPFLFFVFGVLFSYSVIYGLFLLKKEFLFLQFAGINSLFIMCTHLSFYIVSISHKVISCFLKRPTETGLRFNIYCFFVFALVLFIDFFLLTAWNKIKPHLVNYRYLSFLKYI